MAELIDAAKKLAHSAIERGINFPKSHNRTQVNEWCGSALMDTITPDGFDMEAAMENLIEKYGANDIPGGGTKSQKAAYREEKNQKMNFENTT